MKKHSNFHSHASKRGVRGGQNGFTLFEVMVAMGILAISLVAIFNVQGSSILAASRSKFITAASLLARSKLVDIEQELTETGFSDFAEEMEGDFSEEGWPEFSWHAQISKVKIPVPGSMPGEENNAYASMMQGYASMMTDMISNALRECNLTVFWGDRNNMQELTISTHFIEFGRSNMLEAAIGTGNDNATDSDDKTTTSGGETQANDPKQKFNKAKGKLEGKSQFNGLFKSKGK